MTPYEIYARDAVCRQPVYLSSPRESVAMTLFRLRHELRMWHDCWGYTLGKSHFGRIVASGACHSKLPLENGGVTL
jgi:hypothetical protein